MSKSDTKRRGRPFKSDDKCHFERFEFRMTRGERRKLEAAAAIAGKTLTTWIRDTLAAEARNIGQRLLTEPT